MLITIIITRILINNNNSIINNKYNINSSNQYTNKIKILEDHLFLIKLNNKIK